MLFNHFKIAWRVFMRRKLYGVINMLGLSVGIGFSLIVILFVNDEFHYDTFHEKADRLYMLHSLEFRNEDLNTEPGLFDTKPLENVGKSTSMSLAFASLIEENVPEVEKLIRLEMNYTSIELDNKLQTERIHYVDPAFFEYFDYEFVQGDASTALRELDNIVITDEIAMTYLGRLDVVGELFQLNGQNGTTYKIGGVIEKPLNSILQLDVVLRQEKSYVYEERNDWSYAANNLFLLINEGADPAVAAKKIDQLYRTEKADWVNNYKEYRKLSEANPGISYGLINIQDLYLDPTIPYGPSSSPLYSYLLIGVAAIILIIACINYVSISISLSSARSTEVALRKVMGSGRRSINMQFYTEAFLTSFIAILIGYSLMQLSLPLFNELAEKKLAISGTDHLLALGAGLVLTLLISVLAGSVPARIMSGLSIVKSLKSHASHRINSHLIRGLVVFQFTLCIFFIGIGLTMRQQFEYIANADLGYDQEQLVYIPSAWGITDKLKAEYDKEPSIAYSSGVSGLFGSGGSLGRILVKGKEYTTKRVMVDYDFIETLGLELIWGRDFDRERNRETEMEKSIINETMHRYILEDTLNASRMDGVIGIVKDFNFRSLDTEIGPISFNLNNPNTIGTMFARIAPGKTKEGVAALNAGYEAIRPNGTGEVKFMDDYLDKQYANFYRWSKVIDLASIITVLIAASGLFGLTAINVMNRMKEMGIRKVLGAKLGNMLLLLNRQTIWLLLGATLLAFPLWYYFASSWLESFAYHASLGIGLFIGATALCLVIVLLTISFHGVRTSRIDPTQLLRDE